MGGYYERADNGDGTYSQLVKRMGRNILQIAVMQGTVITAGSNVSSYQLAKSDRIGVAVSFVGSSAIKHTVTARPCEKDTSAQVAPDITVFDQTTASVVAGGSFQPITESYELRIINADTIDSTLRAVLITNFI